MKKIIICGGHLTPALALIEILQKKEDLQIIFLGRKYATEGAKNIAAEYRLVSQKKIKFYKLHAGKLQRTFTKYTIPVFIKIPLGFIQSFYFLVKERPNLVVSFGGYLSTPVVLAAWLLGIKSITHEQSSIPGFANRINALFSDKLLLSWPQSKKYFKASKTEVIGNPLRSDVLKKRAASSNIDKFISNSKNLLFVTGGNQGSHFINKLIREALPQLDSFDILHQLGTANYKGDFDKALNLKKVNYLPVDYVSGADLGAVLNSASIVISRCGANTIWELAALGKPAILIPMPTSAYNEQLENAKLLENAKSAIILDQKVANSKILIERVNFLKKNYRSYQLHAQEFSRKIPRDSAQKLAKLVISYT